MKRESSKIDLEIYIIFVILIGISVFNAIYCSLKISNNQEENTRIMLVDIPSLQALERMNLLLVNSKMYTTNWAYLQGNREDKEKLRKLVSDEYPELKGELKALMSLWKSKNRVDSINSVFRNFELLLTQQKLVIALLHGQDDEPKVRLQAQTIVEQEILPQSAVIGNTLSKIILDKKEALDQQHQLLSSETRSLMWSLMSIAILIVIVVLIAAYYLSNNIIVPTLRLKNNILQMGIGEIPFVEPAKRKNALGQMTDAVRKLSESLRKTTRFAHEIGEGNFRGTYTPLSQHDELGNALLQMRDRLEVAAIENMERHWRTEGVARMNDVLREHTDDIDKLNNGVISLLVKYLKSYQGAVYLLESGDFSNYQWIELRGSFSLDKESMVRRRIELGEGLIGHCIQDGERIHIKNASPEHSKLNSDQGESANIHLLIIPLKHRGQIYGAIELTSFLPFQEHEIKFLEEAGDNIASAIASVKANTLTRELLEETRKQAERLSAQEDELRQTNEELSCQSKLLQASEEELKQSNNELKRRARELKNQNDILEQAKDALSIKAKELEISSKFKSEFFANMSHELRTPLNSVLILARLLADNKEKNLSGKQKEYAKVIHKSGSDLLMLINDILDISKIEAGKVNLIVEETPVRGIAESMRMMFEEVAREKKVDFETVLHDGLPLNLKTDALRLEQILKNLLSNAFKFTPGGGTVRLEFEPDLGNNYENRIKISVTDTGIGIPEEKHSLIFDAFQQADGSTNRKFGGTGLGLSISKMLATLMGGEIQLKSKPDEGSKFSLLIPLEIEQESDARTTGTQVREASVVSGPSLKDDREDIREGDEIVLIVEDDPFVGQLLIDLAHKKTYKALLANTCEKALEAARQHRPQAVIFDFNLDKVQEPSFVNELKNIKELANIPVHSISNVDRIVLPQEAHSTRCLRKPLDKRDFDKVFKSINNGKAKELKQVLIVEDSAIEREIISNLLQNKSKTLSIDFCTNPEDAIKVIEGKKFDTIILDLNLGTGKQDGLQVLNSIRASSYNYSTPVVLFTASTLSADEESLVAKLTQTVLYKDAMAYERLLEETALFLSNVKEEEGDKSINSFSGDDGLSGKTILLVDDDMRNIYALSTALESRGMRVITAYNGRSGIEQLKAHPEIDLVLMDIMMPEMDGFAAMREIRTYSEYATLPVVALTANALNKDRKKCLESGASDYISKPLNMDQLLTLLKVWLNK